MGFKLGQKIIDKLRKRKKGTNIISAPDITRFMNLEYYEGADEVSQTSIFNKTFKEHRGHASGKWEQYLSIYNRLFAPYILKGKSIKVLEIGILNGGFLQILQKILPKGSKITGLDICEKCAELELDKNINVIIGNIADDEFFNKNFADSKFDIIIDDASHLCKDVINNFERMFDKLNEGGLYIVEDCHTSYWQEYYGGGFRNEYSSIEYFKKIADSVNFYYIIEGEVDKEEYEKLKKLNQQVASVSFYDSVIVVEKYAKQKTKPFRNYLVGETSFIAPKENLLKYGHMHCDTNTKFEKFYK